MFSKAPGGAFASSQMAVKFAESIDWVGAILGVAAMSMLGRLGSEVIAKDIGGCALGKRLGTSVAAKVVYDRL